LKMASRRTMVTPVRMRVRAMQMMQKLHNSR
jgi:hypothetical protein